MAGSRADKRVTFMPSVLQCKIDYVVVNVSSILQNFSDISATLIKTVITIPPTRQAVALSIDPNCNSACSLLLRVPTLVPLRLNFKHTKQLYYIFHQNPTSLQANLSINYLYLLTNIASLLTNISLRKSNVFHLL